MGTNPRDEFPLLFYSPPTSVQLFQTDSNYFDCHCDEAIRFMQNKSTWINCQGGRLLRCARNDSDVMGLIYLIFLPTFLLIEYL